jgi:HD-like signal output (HDOD) protein
MDPLTLQTIQLRIKQAPRLASLRSINIALTDLLKVEMGVTSQIAEIIKRDPSLTSRLLQLVNSAVFGLTHPIHNIEEAIFYLGLRQIKQLATATPVIQDLHRLSHTWENGIWEKLWQHALASALLTREILTLIGDLYTDETDYILGLLHNIGSIISAALFPEHFQAILNALNHEHPISLAEASQRIIGLNYAEMGAYYLEYHQLSPEITEGIRYQLNPENASVYAKPAAAIQLATTLARCAGILGIENTPPLEETDWPKLSGWPILFGEDSENYSLIIASLKYTLEQLPLLLKGMV